MITEATLTEILEAADQLSLEDQKNLIDILQKRLRDHQKAAIIRDIQADEKEFTEGQCEHITVTQLESISNHNSDILASVPLSITKDYEKIFKARGILKLKKQAILSHLYDLRQEWNQ